MLGPTVTKMSKKAPAPKGGIEKDKKAAMLQADKSNKIPKPSICRGNNTTTHSHRDADDKGTDGLHDERPQRIGVKRPRRVSSLDGLAFYCTRHFIPPSAEVPYVIGRGL